MLAGILLGATAGRGNPNGIEGAILAGQSAMIQHQINYTRDNEFEADRIGISTMVSAGYDPLGMASFFDYMSQMVRTRNASMPCSSSSTTRSSRTASRKPRTVLRKWAASGMKIHWGIS